jgi:RNA polymerase sigma-70 factor (ECF subfamily)
MVLVPDIDTVGGRMPTAEDRFRLLYERHVDDLERFVRRRIHDAEVRDVVTDVFMVAWRRIADVPDDPLPWLYRTAALVLANQIRGLTRRSRLTARVADHLDASVGDHADDVATRVSVAAAFQRLPEAHAEALRLVAWEALSMREAAKVAGCSTAAFVMRLHRARVLLRRELDLTAAPATRLATLTGENR